MAQNAVRPTVAQLLIAIACVMRVAVRRQGLKGWRQQKVAELRFCHFLKTKNIIRIMDKYTKEIDFTEQIRSAKFSSKRRNDLPDSDFAYIEPGGKKDSEGKTTPRSLRHFPIPDAAHVRNALARLPQSKLSPEAKAKALGKIKAAAKRFGIKVSEK